MELCTFGEIDNLKTLDGRIRFIYIVHYTKQKTPNWPSYLAVLVIIKRTAALKFVKSV